MRMSNQGLYETAGSFAVVNRALDDALGFTIFIATSATGLAFMFYNLVKSVKTLLDSDNPSLVAAKVPLAIGGLALGCCSILPGADWMLKKFGYHIIPIQLDQQKPSEQSANIFLSECNISQSRDDILPPQNGEILLSAFTAGEPILVLSNSHLLAGVESNENNQASSSLVNKSAACLNV